MNGAAVVKPPHFFHPPFQMIDTVDSCPGCQLVYKGIKLKVVHRHTCDNPAYNTWAINVSVTVRQRTQTEPSTEQLKRMYRMGFKAPIAADQIVKEMRR